MGGRVRCARNAWHLITPTMIVSFMHPNRSMPVVLLREARQASVFEELRPEDKTVNEEQEGLVLHGTTRTAPSRTAIITMSARGAVVESISGPCADLG